MEQNFKSAALSEIREGHSPFRAAKVLELQGHRGKETANNQTPLLPTLENQGQALSGREHRLN